jgi:hypothetical protein
MIDASVQAAQCTDAGLMQRIEGRACLTFSFCALCLLRAKCPQQARTKATMITPPDAGTARALWASLIMLAHAAVAQAPAPPAPEAAQPSQAPSAPPTAPDPAAWHTLSGPGHSFTADLPAAPAYTTSEMKTGTGSLYTVHQYLFEQGDVAYIVQTATYPEDINVSNPRTNLQGGLDHLARTMEGARWASIEWVSHQGLTATDAVGTRSGHAIRSYSVMKGRQVFTLIYAGGPGTARAADVNRFVGSLRVSP